VEQVNQHVANIDASLVLTNSKLDATNGKLDELVSVVKAKK
jgi:hypothetical protein